MAGFYSARGWTIPPLPWPTFAPPLSVTQAEAKVAEGLFNGFSAKELAANGGVSVETIRTHMKSLFAKTGASRQAEFIARLSSLKF